MDVLVFDKAGADQVRGNYGRFSALDPVALPDGMFMIPKRCLTHNGLEDAVTVINDNVAEENVIWPLPAMGEWCAKGVLYTDTTIRPIDEEPASNVLKCVQTHNRTEHDPKTIPALFTFFRANPDGLALDWIENEWIDLGWLRMFGGVEYECIQAHMSITGQTPNLVPAIWNAASTGEWVQPTGSHDAYQLNDEVTHNGSTWRSDYANNVWEPGIFGWTEI